MKKIILFALLALSLCLFAACSSTTLTPADNADAPENGVIELFSYGSTFSSPETYINSNGTISYQAIVEVINKGNSNLYLGPGSFDIEDTNGNLIAVKDQVSVFPNVIAPGEKGYYYEYSTLDIDEVIVLVIEPHLEIEKATIDYVR